MLHVNLAGSPPSSPTPPNIEAHKQVRFYHQCALIPREHAGGLLRSLPSVSTKSYSISLPWSSGTNSVYQLDCYAAQRAKDPSFTLKLPSLTSRPSRRPSVSNEANVREHHPPMRSCMRRSSLSPSRTGKEVGADLKNDNSADTSDAAPNMHILPPLVEDSNFLSQLTGLELPSFPTAPSSDPSSSPPPPSAYKRSREKSASMSGVQSSTSTASMAATCSSSGATAAPASSSPLSRTLSPVSYFARRRGASLSSTLPSTSSATPSLSFASATAESSSEVTSLASTSTFFHHHHKEEAAATVPLAPCCPQCIRTLSSHPSSLLPVDSERDAHWSRGAWAKKQADELEEKAIRDSAAISNGNAGASCTDGDSSQPPTSSCADRLWTAPEHHADDDAGLDVVSAAKRTPLSPASIKRNRELRLSLDLSSLGTELLKVPNDGESPGLDTDVADLGVQALKAHSRLGRRNSSDDDEFAVSEEEDEEEGSGGDDDSKVEDAKETEPVSAAHVISAPASTSPLSSSPTPADSTHTPPKTSTPPPSSFPAVSTTTTPTPQPTSTPTKFGLMNRLRRGSAPTPPTPPSSSTHSSSPSPGLRSMGSRGNLSLNVNLGNMNPFSALKGMGVGIAGA